MTINLSVTHHLILNHLREMSVEVPVDDLVSEFNLDQAQVSAIVFEAAERGWVVIREEIRTELSRFDPHAYPEVPERKFIHSLEDWTELTMQQAAERAATLNVKLNEVLRWGIERGWLRKEKGHLILTAKGKGAAGVLDPDEKAIDDAWNQPVFLEALKKNGHLTADEVAEAERMLSKRPEFAKIRKRTFRFVAMTSLGREAVAGAEVRIQKTRLSTEDIVSGAWRNIDLKPYDVTLAAETAVPVKPHPFQRMLEDVRRAFLEMGFTEVVSPMVESAFWDFDALYQPQDHPARDMQDTFYLERPKMGRLPADELVERVRQTHENGWETGSTGWGYRWSHDRAREMVLRTHTTATTIRALAEDPNPPRKVFCVGRVFRNENITYKHLPEFHQVDGVIIDKDANFATLLGTLREFYRKMGFEKIKFKPEFFPYTEPSAGVFVYMESKQRWLELGGSGVFRPEVTRPLGCEVPVLAWGLGLERLAMTLYGIQDIRTLYWTDLDWLKEVALCQSSL